MSMRIMPDEQQPTASVEWMIAQPLPDFDLETVEAPVPRDVDPMLASEGFKDLLDEARAILERELAGSGLEITQLTGAICHDADVYRPGIWLVVREKTAPAGGKISAEALTHLEKCAEAVRARLGLS
jgi:hypothetical protein